MSGAPIGPDLLQLLPQLGAVLAAVLALVAEMLRRPRWARWLAVGGLLVAAALAVPHLSTSCFVLPTHVGTDAAPGASLLPTCIGQGSTVFQGTYRIDALSTWAALILLPATALAVLLVAPEVEGTDREGTVYALLVFTTVGALVLAGSGDLIFLLLGVLIISLGGFALVAYPRADRATEAALKYFVFGSVSEAVMIFGLTFWFGATGSTELGSLAHLDARLPAVAGLIGLLVGLGYKAALVPLHFWAPDAYDGGPLAVAAYLSVVPKIGALFALAQAARTLPDGTFDWRLLLALVAALSMTYGNLAALGQTNLVRLLAYSSIAQAGYLLLPVVALGRSTLAEPALVVFAAAYAAMNLGAFAVLARVGRGPGAPRVLSPLALRAGSGLASIPASVPTRIADIEGLARSSPWLAGALVVFLLSLVGVPPLAGFFGKLLLFGAAVDAGYAWLAVIGVLNSVLSLAVYLRLIVPAYRSSALPPRTIAPGPLVYVTLVLTVVLGVAVQVLLGKGP